MGLNQFSLQDMGSGPRVSVAEWHEGGYFNHAGSCAVVSPDDLRTIKGTELHHPLVQALQRSRERGGGTVAIWDAKGRWQAIRNTIEAARQ